MGRWGMRLFEGDQDIDIATDISVTFGQGVDDMQLSRLVHHLYYHSEEEEYDKVVAEARQKLDTNGLGDRLMAHWRGKESEPGYPDHKYYVVITGALMMQVGAKIQESDIEHLRAIVPRINCNEGYTVPIYDQGFRGPGKAQFIAALWNYKPGVPRNFEEPSCFYCGKVEADIGKELMKCGGCKNAWYCDKDCQKPHWKVHKPTCQRSDHCMNM